MRWMEVGFARSGPMQCCPQKSRPARYGALEYVGGLDSSSSHLYSISAMSERHMLHVRPRTKLVMISHLDQWME